MAAQNEIEVLVKAEIGKYIKDLKKAEGKSEDFGKKTSKGLSRIKGAWLAVGAVMTGVVAVAFKKTIGLAIDMEEATSKFLTVFKDVQAEAKGVRDNLVKSFGLSKKAATELLSATGDLLSGFGFTGKSALGLSKQVNELAVDLASFSNAQGGAAAVSDALTKALLGERESLKTYGIAILEADIKQRLFEKGQKSLTGLALRQAKAQATLELAMEQSKNAIGDYARTSDGAANTIRRLGARFEDFRANVGSALLTAINPIIQKIDKWTGETTLLTDAVDDLTKANRRSKEITEKLSGPIDDVTSSQRKLLEIERELIQLDTVKKINDINDAYVKQKKRLEALNKIIKTAAELNANLADKAPGNIGLLKVLARVERAQIERKKKAILIEKDLAQGEAATAKAIQNGNLTKAQQSFLNDELIKEALILIDALKEVKPAGDKGAEGIEGMTKSIDEFNKRLLKGLTIKQLIEEFATQFDEEKRLLEEREKNYAKFTEFVLSGEEARRKSAKDTASELIATGQFGANEILMINQQLNERLKEIDDEILTRRLNNSSKYLQRVQSTFNDIKKISDQYISEEISRVDQRTKQNIAGLNAAELGEEKYDKARTTLREKGDKKIVELKKKQFNIDKAASIVNITLLGALSAIRQFAELPFPAAIAATAAIATLQGVQTGIVASQKFPAFRQGGFTPGGTVMVGEEGPELVNLPRGSEVITAKETTEIRETVERGGNVFNFYGIEDISAARNELQKTEGTGAFL